MGEYDKKFLEGIREKIIKWQELNDRICEIEEAGDDPDNNTEYGLLCYDQLELGKEIEKQLIESRYTLLAGLTDWEGEELVFHSLSTGSNEDIENHLRLLFQEMMSGAKARLQKIKPLYVNSKVLPGVRRLYREVMRCYVLGAFDAASALCRATAEYIVKDLIIKNGHGELLHQGKKKGTEPHTLIGILKTKLNFTNRDVKPYCKIARNANGILHDIDNLAITEGHASELIGLLQEFIENSRVYSITDDSDIEEV